MKTDPLFRFYTNMYYRLPQFGLKLIWRVICEHVNLASHLGEEVGDDSAVYRPLWTEGIRLHISEDGVEHLTCHMTVGEVRSEVHRSHHESSLANVRLNEHADFP